ncbi:MAG: lipopolysaccharide kinase InaA family protein [Gammaproteobacteria bacterium]
MATSCIKNMNNPKENVIRTLTWDDLKQADRNLPVPFQLVLTGNDEPVICEEIIRILPGKRLVAFGFWGKKLVVAKLFFERGSAKRHLKREIEGVESLLASAIPTPKLLWQGSSQKNKIQVLLFERIVDADNLDTIWQDKKSPDEAVHLMQAIIIELATQHVMGIVQNDLHLKNFLVTEKHIYTLDGGSIKKIDGILPKEDSLDHLALFFAQLGVGTEELQETLFQTYIKARSWIIKPADIEFLRKATRKWIEKRWDRYEKKIQRNSTAFARKKTLKTLTMYDRDYQSAGLYQLLQNPEAIFQDKNTMLLKAGRTSTVAKIKIDQHEYVIKRYNVKNVWHWLRRCLRPTRAATSWVLAQRLRLFAIPTPKPVAFIEKRFLNLRGTSYFIMEYIDGPHVGEYFAKYRSEDHQLVAVAKNIIKLFVNLAKLRLTHGDLKKTNILIEKNRPMIIDLDGMVEHRSQFGLRFAFKKEMRRFMKNWDNMPSVRELFLGLIQRL